MAPGSLAAHRRGGVAWALLALALISASCASAGLIATDAAPGRDALAASRPSPAVSTLSPAAPATPTLSSSESLVATATVASVPVYPSLGAATPNLQLANPIAEGAPLTFLVVTVQSGWVEVDLPVRPNGAQGWVPLADLSITSDQYRITVSLLARQLTVYAGGAAVTSAPVAVGSPDSPTPIGSFYVTEVLRITDPQNAYGPYALGLSAFSDTYYSFDGGPGQIAIHGTNQPWVIGGYASHGCVRLANPDIARIAGFVPAGTPVSIGL